MPSTGVRLSTIAKTHMIKKPRRKVGKVEST